MSLGSRTKSLSEQELLAVVLGKGTPGMDLIILASKLVRLIDEKGLVVKAKTFRSLPILVNVEAVSAWLES